MTAIEVAVRSDGEEPVAVVSDAFDPAHDEMVEVPVVVGGIIPEPDAVQLLANGVARVFTPKDFAITDVLGQIVDAIDEARAG